MFIKIWGCRGSVAVPGPFTIRFGGNTTCIEVRSDSGELLILDAGTGICNLTQNLLGEVPFEASLLLSHTHYDHIIGFPFFTPIFIPGNRIDVYGPTHLGLPIKEAMIDFFCDTFFPANLEDFQSKVTFTSIGVKTWKIGSFNISTFSTNHPITTLAYRIECDGKVFVYSGDTEPFLNFLENVPEATKEDRQEVDEIVNEQEESWRRFLSKSDLCVYDAHFTPEEYPQFVGWGHASMQHAIEICEQAKVKKLLLSHHSPQREDSEIESLQSRWKAFVFQNKYDVVTDFAVEGRRYDL
jgi:phosphoribosyl 1,2-cyclic phosphodiesterase